MDLQDVIVRGKFVLTDARAGEDGIISDGAAHFSEGIVAEVGRFDSLKKTYPRVRIIGNGKQLLMPGLIDAHSHGRGLSFIQGGIPYDFLENCLLDWAFMPRIDPELNAMLSAVRHIWNGCTTIHHNNFGEPPDLSDLVEKIIKAYQQSGIRLAFSFGIRNINRLALDDTKFLATLPPDLQKLSSPMVYFDRESAVDEYFDLFEHLYSTYNNDDLRIIFGPSWVQGATDSFLTRIKSRADKLDNIPIHIHTLQTPIQKAYGIKKYGKSLVCHLDDLGVLDKNLTLGHAVFLTDSDIGLLVSKGTSITHHPSCNLAMRNGIAPVYNLHRAGVKVALGIDDKAINDDDDAIMELRMIHHLHRISNFDLSSTPALNAFDILTMGTHNSASVCGFDGKTGSLRPGMKADAILVDLDEIMEDPWMSPNFGIAEAFIHRAKGTHVNTAIVGGRVIMQDRQILTIDVNQLYEEIRKQASRGLDSAQKKHANMLKRIKPYYQEWYKEWLKGLEFKPFYPVNSRK